MKTIEISEEDYNFLKECKELLNTQNNRATRNPIYTIQDVEKIPTSSDYADGSFWIDVEADYYQIGSDEELFEYLWDYDGNYKEKIIEYLSEEGDEEKEDFKKLFLKEIQYDDDLAGFGIECISNYYYLEKWFIKEGAVFSFFEKDAFDHLESNHYHYTEKARTYGCSLWRSPKMERLRKFLMELEI